TRVILSAEPARTTARTSSPSITIPNSATSGGEGGGGGGSGAAATAGGGGGGRRVGENSGCSRVADRLSSGCSASGLGRAAPRSPPPLCLRGRVDRRGRRGIGCHDLSRRQHQQRCNRHLPYQRHAVPRRQMARSPSVTRNSGSSMACCDAAPVPPSCTASWSTNTYGVPLSS